MREVSFLDAKDQLDSVVDDAVEGRPTVITRHGRRTAVVVSFDEWSVRPTTSLWDMVLSAPIEGEDLPQRDRRPLRDVDL